MYLLGPPYSPEIQAQVILLSRTKAGFALRSDPVVIPELVEREETMPTMKENLGTAKLVLACLFAFSVLILIFQNQEPVQTQLLFWQVEMPRFLLLAGVYGVGIATGWVVFWRSSRRTD